MNAGGVVSDDFIYRLSFKEIKACLDRGKGVVLDGAIRNVAQAEKYQEFFTEQGVAGDVVAIEFSMSDEASFERLASRLADGSGAGRADDTPEVLRERLKHQGNAALRPIAEYYKKRGALLSISGEKSIDEVYGAMVSIIRA